jgi:hypothetical protein
VGLIVRLAKDGEPSSLGGHVAMFRRPGMVVSYWDRSALAQGTRQFHAILAAGEARDPSAVTDADRAVERFLRDAEPPGHDDWISTPALKEAWKPGYAKAIAQLKERVVRELRELLTPRPSHGARGPERLQRRFPIGKGGRREGQPSAFKFSDLDAAYDGERWSFRATVRPAQRARAGWEATVRLFELGDRGLPLDAIGIDALVTSTDGAQIELVAGTGYVTAGPSVERVELRGTSAVLEASGEILVEVGGRLGPGAA